MSPRPTPHPQGERRLPERDQPPTEPSTLSKQQMLNALQYLLVVSGGGAGGGVGVGANDVDGVGLPPLQNDEGFVDKLHDAYRKSTSHQ